MYGSTTELFRVLKIRSATPEQTAAATRYLTTATIEIDTELDRAADAAALTSDELLLVDSVAIDRAADLWRHTESIPGVMGVLDDTSPSPTPSGYWRYSWERYAQRLAPLKDQWGVA